MIRRELICYGIAFSLGSGNCSGHSWPLALNAIRSLLERRGFRLFLKHGVACARTIVFPGTFEMAFMGSAKLTGVDSPCFLKRSYPD
jgi:hypothetical protein